MKAIAYSKYGSPDVLQIKEVEKPKPGDNDILIKICAVEVTKGDCEIRSFRFAARWFWLPMRIATGLMKPKKQILGGYFAGKVEDLGKNVSKFKRGDQVFGVSGLYFGAYGEYLSLPTSCTIVKMPKNMSFVEAAAVPLGGLNALHFMRKANIKPGEKVLINGAGSSIGTFSVQIAKAMGAEVTAVDTAIKQEMLHSIGVDHFLDSDKVDFTQRGQKYDVIFNVVAQIPYTSCVNSLNRRGRYLIGNPRLADMWRSFFTSNFTRKTTIFSFAGEKEEELIELKKMIETGQLRSMVDKVYLPEQIAEAHHRVESEQRRGVIVMDMEKS